MTRNEARKIMMQILFELEASGGFKGECPADTAEKLAGERLSGNHAERGKALLKDISQNINSLDDIINSCSSKWKTGRMPKVDLAIMRLATGELTYSDDIPEAVSINEAINLAKEYSTENSAKFVHGVLGAVAKKIKENE